MKLEKSCQWEALASRASVFGERGSRVPGSHLLWQDLLVSLFRLVPGETGAVVLMWGSVLIQQAILKLDSEIGNGALWPMQSMRIRGFKQGSGTEAMN